MSLRLEIRAECPLVEPSTHTQVKVLLVCENGAVVRKVPACASAAHRDPRKLSRTECALKHCRKFCHDIAFKTGFQRQMEAGVLTGRALQKQIVVSTGCKLGVWRLDIEGVVSVEHWGRVCDIRPVESKGTRVSSIARRHSLECTALLLVNCNSIPGAIVPGTVPHCSEAQICRSTTGQSPQPPWFTLHPKMSSLAL